MSPLIEMQNKVRGCWGEARVIADVPDESGVYETSEGDLTIDFRQFCPESRVVRLQADFLGGGDRYRGKDSDRRGPTVREIAVSKKKGVGSTLLDANTKLTITLKGK